MEAGEHERIAVNGVELCARVDGPEAGFPLVLLNGAGLNLYSWSPIMERLQARYRVLRFDWRGSGGSSGGERSGYTFLQYADDLAALLDRYEMKRAVVVGLAYGARTAARFALRYPERTALLALYDVSLDQPVDQRLQEEGRRQARALRKAAGPETFRFDRAWMEHRDPRSAGRSLTAHEGQPDPTPELASLQVPTLVACGRQDVNLPQAERIASLMPDAELRIMERTGHGSILQRPDLVADLLLDFLERRLEPAA